MAGKKIKNPGEIGKRIEDLEKAVKTVKQSNEPVIFPGAIFAKVNQNNGDGTYNLTEQVIDETNATFTDKEGGRTWGMNADDLNPAREINTANDIPEDTIVIVFKVAPDGLGVFDNEWIIMATSADGVSIVATDKSNTIVQAKIQFRNDITFNADASGVVNLQLGDVSNGCVAYGGNEQPGGSGGEIDGYQRHYKYIYDVEVPIAGYLIPQTYAQISQDIDDYSMLGELIISLTHRSQGQTCEIDHNVLSESQLNNDEELKHEYVNIDGDRGIVYGYGDAAGTTLVPIQFGRWGHAPAIDDVYTIITPPPIDALIAQMLSGYPSSGTLYDIPLTQETNLTDENNNNTDIFNGNNRLTYTAKDSNGNPLDIGFAVSTSASQIANATDFAGPGTGGNNTDMRFHLARTLNGQEITLQSELNLNGKKAVASVTVDEVYLETEIQTTPVPDNSSFDVKTILLDGAGGADYTRFNADGEYDIITYLYYETDGFDINNPIASQTDTVAALGGGESGVTVSFTVDFPDFRLGSNVCARSFLLFERTAVNPQPLANQTGVCTISNGGNFSEDCEPITGTAATGDISIPMSAYSPDGTTVSIGGDDYTQLDTPIVVTYTIDKGGNTTDFSDANVVSTIELLHNNIPIDFSEDGALASTSFNEPIINPVNGTDGFTFTIAYVISSEISNGDQYVIRVTTAGVSDSPETEVFSFNNSTAFPATDLFDDTNQNSGSVGDNNWTDRWTETLSTNGSQTITSNTLVHSIAAAAGTDSVLDSNRFSDGTNPNITTDTWLFSTQMDSISLANNGESQSLTVNNVALDALQMGYRYAGGQQEIYTSDDGGVTDLYSESSSASSGNIIIKRDDLKFSEDWTGSGQNSPSTTHGSFPGRWTLYGPSGTTTINTSAGEADISVPTGGGGTFEFAGYTNSIDLFGDFEVSMTMDVTQVELNASVSSGVGFDVTVNGIGQASCFMNKINADSGAEWGQYSAIVGSETLEVSNYNSDTVTFTVIQSSGIISFEYNGIAMTETYNNAANDNVNIAWLGGTRSTVTAFEATFSALIIDTEQFGKRVLMQEGGNLKYSLDDSASAVTSHDLLTETTNTLAYDAIYANCIAEAPINTTYTYDTNLL